jgi:hypothetical protein
MPGSKSAPSRLSCRTPIWGARPGALLLGLLVVLAGAAAGESARESRAVRIHRTWMPNAYPSSFAVGFPGGLNVCFDPIRANVIYAWAGDFVDLQPTVNGKIPRDAVIRGTIFYQPRTVSGFRPAIADVPAEIRYKGYRLEEGFPEFHYEVNGVAVAELIRPAPDGSGILRQFRVAAGNRALIYQPDSGSALTRGSGPAEWSGEALQLPGKAAVVFTVKIARP